MNFKASGGGHMTSESPKAQVKKEFWSRVLTFLFELIEYNGWKFLKG